MKDKKVPQLIILGVLTALCLGFIAFKLMGTKTQAAAPPPAAAQPAPGQQSSNTAGNVPTAANPAVTATSVGKSEEPAAIVSGVPNLPELPKRDPFAPAFVPPLVGVTGPVRIAAAPRVRVSQSPRFPVSALPTYNPNQPMPVLGVRPLSRPSPSSGGTSVAVAPVNGAGEQFPDFRLTGIVRGSTNIAIIRGGDNERHIVREGQYINGRYRIVFIGETSVILACGRDRKELKLGGKTNAI